MYSVVMMAAMIAGGETTDFGGRGGWYPGCYGCYGYGYCGGKGGCWGGCYGGCCGGCYGGCYGCCGGCYGGCYGGCCGGCYGCGSCYSCGGGCYSWGACCGGCYGPVVVPHAVPTMPPAAPSGTDKPKTEDKPKTDDKPKTEASIPANRARLTVELPADAKLFIDDQPTQTTSGVRHFRTPELDPAQTYYYMVRVEIARGGKTHTEEKRILLTPGAQINASFTEESLAGTAKKDGPSAKR